MYDEKDNFEFNHMNPDEHTPSNDQGHQEEGRSVKPAGIESQENAEQSGQEQSRQEQSGQEQSQVNWTWPQQQEESGKAQYSQSQAAQDPYRQAYQNQQAQQSSQAQQMYQNQQGSQSGQVYRSQQGTQNGQTYQNQQTSQTQRPYQSQQASQTGQSSQQNQQGSNMAGQNPLNGGQYYQNGYQNGPVYTHIPPEPQKKPKKKRSMAGRIAGITAAALLFGTVSGGTMVGINVLSDHFRSTLSPVESEKVTLGQALTEGETENNTEQPSTVAQASPAIVTDVSAIVEKAMPSVVAINNTMLYRSNSWFGPSQTYEVPSSGSGIIVGKNDEELLIVTNNHVVADSSNLSVAFIDNESVEASIKGTDSDSDLAVIAVPLSSIPAETLAQISVATIGDSDSLKVGQGVIAIGNALGYGQSVTVGYVSALNREVKTDEATTRTLLQTDAAINPGNSGGALLNMKGELIGINAAKYSSTEVEGMGYAIPISQAQDIINDLMNKKTRVAVDEKKQGYLGIQGKNIDDTASTEFGMPRGVYVYKILDDGAASKSDLREKDIITKFDGETVRSMANLQELLTYYEGGDTVTLTVQSLENGQYVERSVDVTLGLRPEVGTSK